MMKLSSVLLLGGLLALVGCARTPDLGEAPMSNDLTAPVALPRAVKPLPRPALPTPSKGLGGVPDDSVRPIGPKPSNERTGIPDDSIRPR